MDALGDPAALQAPPGDEQEAGFAAALDSGTAAAPKPRTTRAHLGLWRAKGPSERARGLETLQKEAACAPAGLALSFS